MFRHVKGLHQAKIRVTKHKKDTQSLFHRIKNLQCTNVSLQTTVQYGLKIKITSE